MRGENTHHRLFFFLNSQCERQCEFLPQLPAVAAQRFGVAVQLCPGQDAAPYGCATSCQASQAALTHALLLGWAPGDAALLPNPHLSRQLQGLAPKMIKSGND